MTITLKPEQELLIAQALETGAYQSPEEVIGRALELLHSEYEWASGPQDEVADKIDRAFEQFERGEFLTSEESIADMNRRKSEWLSENKR
jgi:Arc/MetJ-type ribon-helix-helix transcriptional regulator